MSETNTIHRQEFTIRANEVDPKAKLTFPALCNFFQEVAGNHARDLNFDITDLRDQNLTWVLHRMDINIHKLPGWRDTIIIETWPAAGDALRAYRNYQIFDENGTGLGNCLSYWMMINLETRRPNRIPKEVLEARFAERNHVTEVKSNRMKLSGSFDFSVDFKVRRSDLDMNNHVNNGRYLEWITECLSYEEIHSIINFDVVFMHESLQGDVITIQVNKSNSSMFEFALINQDQKMIATATAVVSS